MPSSFVHIRVHSHFSRCEGTLLIDEIVQEAVCQGMPAIALTDRNTLGGAVEFHRAARASGIKPILGCDLDVAPRSAHLSAIRAPNLCRLTLLATDFRGYRNLVALSTRASLAEASGGSWNGLASGVLGDHREVFIDSCLANHELDRGEVSMLFDVLSDAAASTLSQSIAIGIAEVIRKSAHLKVAFPDV